MLSRLRRQLQGLLSIRRALARPSTGLGACGAARRAGLEGEEHDPGGGLCWGALVLAVGIFWGEISIGRSLDDIGDRLIG